MKTFKELREGSLEESKSSYETHVKKAARAMDTFDRLSGETQRLAQKMHETSSFTQHASARKKLRAHLDKIDKAASDYQTFSSKARAMDHQRKMESGE